MNSLGKLLLVQLEFQERGIPVQILELVLNEPEQIVEEDDLKVYQGKFIATNGKTYLLRIYVNERVEPPKVVTAYRTSKINKYFR